MEDNFALLKPKKGQHISVNSWKKLRIMNGYNKEKGSKKKKNLNCYNKK
jgi:hypothetical protein